MNDKISPSAESLTRDRYQTIEYAEQYKKDYTSDITFKGIKSRIIAYKELKVVKKFLNLITNKDMKILDIPCGTGKLGHALSSFSITIVAGDISKSMLSLAKNEYKQDKVDFKIIDAVDIPYDDDYFDIIVCLRLFQRIPSETRLKILSEFQRTSTKNLIISYSYTSSWQQMGTMVKNFFIKRSELLFTENLKVIERELNQFGFKVREKKTVLSFLSSEIIILAENK